MSTIQRYLFNLIWNFITLAKGHLTWLCRALYKTAGLSCLLCILWILRAELGFLPFIRVVTLYVSFLMRYILYKTKFYNSFYRKKSGQRLESELWWQLWEQKRKRRGRSWNDEIRNIKGKKTGYVWKYVFIMIFWLTKVIKNNKYKGILKIVRCGCYEEYWWLEIIYENFL